MSGTTHWSVTGDRQHLGPVDGCRTCDTLADSSLTGYCDDDDRYHALCPSAWRTVFGMELTCSCPNHERENDDV